MNSVRLVTLAALIVILPLSAAAEIRITEIMYDAEDADGKREWVEVFNDSTESIDISGWKFKDRSNHVLSVPPKNGGTGTAVIAQGAYIILASDAATFVLEYPQVVNVIDTVMSLNNTGATVSVSGVGKTASASYTASLGATGTGDSLQYTGSSWIHARPTPGAVNATTPTRSNAKITITKKKQPSPAVSKKTVRAEITDEEVADVPPEIEAMPESQIAGAGMAIGWQWGLAASALAVGTGAIAAVITRTKRSEWDIEEAE